MGDLDYPQEWGGEKPIFFTESTEWKILYYTLLDGLVFSRSNKLADVNNLMLLIIFFCW